MISPRTERVRTEAERKLVSALLNSKAKCLVGLCGAAWSDDEATHPQTELHTSTGRRNQDVLDDLSDAAAQPNSRSCFHASPAFLAHKAVDALYPLISSICPLSVGAVSTSTSILVLYYAFDSPFGLRSIPSTLSRNPRNEQSPYPVRSICTRPILRNSGLRSLVHQLL